MPHLRNRSLLGSQTLESQDYGGSSGTRRGGRDFPINRSGNPTITLNDQQISSGTDYDDTHSYTMHQISGEDWYPEPKRHGRTRKLLLAAIFISVTFCASFGIRESNIERVRQGFRKAQATYSDYRDKSSSLKEEEEEVTEPEPEYSITNAQIHLLVPANQADANLCKNVLSSTILGYPSSTVLNWGTYYEWDNSATGSHVAKLTKVNDYLSALPALNDDDLVILVDGYDIWFQLPLQIMLDRYFAINDRANERIAQQLGTERLDDPGVKQTIVVSTQKKCWPGDENDVWCWAVPPSPLPEDLYGPETDVDVTADVEDNFKWQRHRQRYLNSGIVVGPVSHMRRLYTRLLELWHTEMVDELHDQAILANILGMQEYERQVWVNGTEKVESIGGNLQRRQDEEQSDGSDEESDASNEGESGEQGEGNGEQAAASGDTSDENTGNKIESSEDSASESSDQAPSSSEEEDQPPQGHRTPPLDPLKSYQYNLGLDYYTAIGIPTVFSEIELAWFTYNNASSVVDVYNAAEVINPMSMKLGLDLQEASGPFPDPRSSDDLDEGEEADNWSADSTWGDVQLYSNMYTGVTPAIIHHNAHYDNQKENRVNHWDRVWFQPFARNLMTSRLKQPRDQLLAVHKTAAGEIRFWDVDRAMGRGGAMAGDGRRDKGGRKALHHWDGPRALEFACGWCECYLGARVTCTGCDRTSALSVRSANTKSPSSAPYTWPVIPLTLFGPCTTIVSTRVLCIT